MFSKIISIQLLSDLECRKTNQPGRPPPESLSFIRFVIFQEMKIDNHFLLFKFQLLSRFQQFDSFQFAIDGQESSFTYGG